MDLKQIIPSIELIQEIQESLISKNLTVSTAESLTAGMVGSSLATLPGASAMYQGGLIVYNDKAKIDVLGVPASTIDYFGAVSAECAM
ncbi:CinA family protein, partial [Klebsiella pneumoniae]|uniref:CinA family protein n=1 Tax=Klebsiella pneumoniae TaxID=573 RepID=UPI00385464A0